MSKDGKEGSSQSDGVPVVSRAGNSAIISDYRRQTSGCDCPPWLVRLSLRSSDDPTHGDAANGFRCVLDH